MIRIGICEDDLGQLKMLSDIVIKISVQLNLEITIQKFITGDELVKYYENNNKIDILFLDIILGSKNGMDIAKHLRELDDEVEIIFTTAEEKYILRAFEVRAYRYIIKPLFFDDIKKQLSSCINELNKKSNKLVISQNFEKVFINIKDILYVEVRNKELTIHTEKQAFTIFSSLKKLEEEINSNTFVRCHNTYMINLDKIGRIKNNLITINDVEIPISRTRSEDFKIALTNFLSAKL